MTERAYLVLADGTIFEGSPFGARCEAAGEAVFTTGMTGYQEVLTDPSYCGQIVTMTAPQIGNTGVNADDMETAKPAVAGFVVRDLSPIVSSWRAVASLEEFLVEHGIPGITGVDTRSLTRHIRDHGAQTGVIGTGDPAALLARAKGEKGMAGQDLTGRVSTTSRYEWSESSGSWSLSPEKPAKHHVVAIDYGVKRNILRCLVDSGCKVTVVPSTASADEILALSPDGVFLSNGPGDPAAVTHGIETISSLVGKKPIFGICLGHQMLALALGAKTYKLKFGHRGLNQPVKDLGTGRIEITTQNHGFAVDVDSLPDGVTMTHVHLNDGTCQGIEVERAGAFSVQFHPEAAAGPHDSRYLFERFISKMDEAGGRSA
jgi:carbamoyl-phosphate synthase small subunit